MMPKQYRRGTLRGRVEEELGRAVDAHLFALAIEHLTFHLVKSDRITIAEIAADYLDLERVIETANDTDAAAADAAAGRWAH